MLILITLMTDKRDKQVNVSVTLEEYEAILEYSRQEHSKVAPVIRKIVLDKILKKETPAEDRTGDKEA
jgi:hypothetical protein